MASAPEMVHWGPTWACCSVSSGSGQGHVVSVAPTLPGLELYGHTSHH